MATKTSSPGRRSGRGVLGLILGVVVILGTVTVLETLATPRPNVEASLALPVGRANAVDAQVAATHTTCVDAPPISPAVGAPPDLTAVPDATTDWWSAVSASIEGGEYKFTAAEEGFQAPNRAHNFRSRYRETAVEIEPRERSAEEVVLWRLSWRTKAWGRSLAMAEVGTASPEVNAEGTRVTYQHHGMSEWYENRKEGLEQGFTVHERPAGEGPLRIEGEFGGAGRPILREGGAVDLVDENDVALVRYGELAAWDAAGQEVPASLAVARNTVAIVVDDRGAKYPLIVDPLMTTPAWTVESNQVGAGLGLSVATAGDVNGDHFSDVIVGAPFYDNGQTSEGRALAYYGSAAGLAATAAWSAESNQTDAEFGMSVATAGDVNNDGYSDVIIGAWHYGNGQAWEGRAFVYHGSATGLAATAAWTAESNQTSAEFGKVAAAGDVNNDGYSDVIVGAASYDNGQSLEGRAYVFHGSATGLAAAPAWTAESNQHSALFGHSVATAGDVNGDGFADVIVGAHYFGALDEGRAFVYHGSAVGLAGTAAWIEDGPSFALFGVSVSTAGDVNGDGFSDVIVGAIAYSNGQDEEGGSFVYHGSSAGLAATPAWTAESNQVGAWFGYPVTTAGDVNGDGYADVVVGAFRYDNGETNEGRTYVYLGSPSGLGPTVAWTAESNQADADFGNSAATAGDVNGDGFADVIVGAREFDNGQSGEGQALVYHGSAAGLATSVGWTAESNQASANFGYSVSTAGDVNGDGYSDVVVGAYRYDNGQTDEGRAYVYHGSPSGPAPAASWTAESNQASSRYGESVSTAGDVNGDGFSDVVVGSPGFDNGQSGEGRAYVYHGSASGLATTAARTVESNLAGAEFGISVSTAGDVNADGYGDVIVGAWLFANGQSNEGRAFAYHGSASGIGSTATWTRESNQASAWFGYSVSTAGDVNGDGFSDVIVGAPMYDNGQTNEGRTFAYHGSAAGLATTGWTAETNLASSQLGWSVSTAGDVNGDGFSDVIVSAVGEGRVLIYRGSATGLPTSVTWQSVGSSSAFFGWSVSTAGDVNGDGFSDVIIGARRYDNGQTDEGRAYVYHGSAAWPGIVPDWTGESNQAGAEFGHSVSTAGDVNGDGYSDVIVGAHLFDNGQTDEGRAFIYYGNNRSRLIRPRSVRMVEDTPIAILGGSDSPHAFRLEAIGVSPGGRARVWLEYEVKPLGVPFDGLGLLRGLVKDTGFPQNLGSLVLLTETQSGLSPETPYHWRLRVASDSPFFPWSRWVSPIGNAPSETDLRTAVGQLQVSEIGLAAPGPRLLASVNPNPFGATTELGYRVPEAGPLHLKVYSVTGREVAVLVDEVQNAGEYRVRWDGRDREGHLLPAGVYFAQLELGDRIEAQKLVLAR